MPAVADVSQQLLRSVNGNKIYSYARCFRQSPSEDVYLHPGLEFWM